MVALANWLQRLFSTNQISAWKNFPASMEYNGYSCPTYRCPYACHQDFCLKETTRTPLRRSWLAALHCFSCSGDPMGCLHSSESPDLVPNFYLGLSFDFTSFWLASKWFLGCCYWPISRFWLLAVWMDYVAFLVSGQPPPIAALDPRVATTHLEYHQRVLGASHRMPSLGSLSLAWT